MIDVRRTSKFMSMVLRHRPEKAGITLDENGWVLLDEFLRAMAKHGHKLTMVQLEKLVQDNDKQRFTIKDGRIRANQGHSVEVDLQLVAKEPPDVLFHGTALNFLGYIQAGGLKKMSRHHVHLSRDADTAKRVASRRMGQNAILAVESGRMHHDGYEFYESDNGVWLTDHVPPEYIRWPGNK